MQKALAYVSAKRDVWTCVLGGQVETITTAGICSNAAVLAGVYFHLFAYKVARL